MSLIEKLTRLSTEAASGGRPLRGGSAGRAPAGSQAAFSLLVEMLSHLEPSCSWKVSLDLANTL